MAYEFRVGDDGIARLVIIGDQNEADAQSLYQEMKPFLDAKTGPLHLIVDTRRGGKNSSRARKVYIDLARNSTKGKTAILSASRYTRLMIRFVLKAVGQAGTIDFFETEEEALRWIQGDD